MEPFPFAKNLKASTHAGSESLFHSTYRGALEMAKRQGPICGQIFRFAIASGKAEIDPVPSLRGALKPVAKGRHAAITPDELPEFIRIPARPLAARRPLFRLFFLAQNLPSRLLRPTRRLVHDCRRR
jgi:hypothetical protein